MDDAGVIFVYIVRVVSQHSRTTSGEVTATEYTVKHLRRTDTRYTVYVGAVSFGLYGHEVSIIVSTAVGSESL